MDLCIKMSTRKRLVLLLTGPKKDLCLLNTSKKKKRNYTARNIVCGYKLLASNTFLMQLYIYWLS